MHTQKYMQTSEIWVRYMDFIHISSFVVTLYNGYNQ